MQQMICCVDFINGSWRAWKRNQIPPTNVTIIHMYIRNIIGQGHHAPCDKECSVKICTKVWEYPQLAKSLVWILKLSVRVENCRDLWEDLMMTLVVLFVDMVMQQMICCVDFINGSWRAWKRNQIPPTNVTIIHMYIRNIIGQGHHAPCDKECSVKICTKVWEYPQLAKSLVWILKLSVRVENCRDLWEDLMMTLGWAL